MAVLFKYLAGVGAIISVVMVLSAMTMSKIIVVFSVVTTAPATATPRWNSERLSPEVLEYVGLGSLSPIYPATPGKELFGKPAYAASTKRIAVHQALQPHKLPLQLFPKGERDNNFPQQSLSYTEMSSSAPRISIISRHEIY
jgi:hypothetical protein